MRDRVQGPRGLSFGLGSAAVHRRPRRCAKPADQRLSLGAGRPWTVTERDRTTLRVVYSDGDRPIEVTVVAKAGHLYELQYEFV